MTENIETSKTSSAKKLAKAAQEAYKTFKPFRDERTNLLKEYAGRNYGDGKGSTRKPFNLIFSLVNTLVPNLSVRDITGVVTTEERDYRFFADRLRVVTDSVCRKAHVARSIRMAIMDALFSGGIVKTGLGPTDASLYSTDEDGLADPGVVYSEHIDFDDWITDIARNRDGASFEGNKYRVPFEWAMSSDMFPKSSRKILEKLRKDSIDRKGRAESLTTGDQQVDNEGWNQQIELVDLYLPRTGMIVTLPGTLDDVADYIAEREYVGPPGGPYDVLGFHKIPSNLMAVPVTCVIKELVYAINRVANKAIRQAERQKDIGVVNPLAAKTGEAIKDASDGQVVLGNPKDAGVLSFGGINKVNYESISWLMSNMNQIDGNLDLVGGLNQSSDKVGTNAMLMNNANIRLTDMRAEVAEFGGSIYAKMGWYVWNDPTLKMKVTQRTPNGMMLQSEFTPEMRVGELGDYEFKLQAYPALGNSPQERYQQTKEFITQVILPLSQYASQQGLAPNVAAIAALAGRQLDVEGADEIFSPAEPQTLGFNPKMPAPGLDENNTRLKPALGENKR